MGRFARLVLNAAPLLVAVAAAPAAAADLGAGFGVNGGATVVSDYRFRGISQTNRRFAVQGTFSISHSSGFYGTVWGSSIDDYVANGSDTELDLIIGYKKSFGSTTIDGGVLYYYYPGSGGIDSDFGRGSRAFDRCHGDPTVKPNPNLGAIEKPPFYAVRMYPGDVGTAAAS